MSKKKIIIIGLITLICLCIGRYDKSNNMGNTGSSILDWSNRSNGTGFYIGDSKKADGLIRAHYKAVEDDAFGDFGKVEDYIDPEFRCNICHQTGTCVSELGHDNEGFYVPMTKECNNLTYCAFCGETIFKCNEEVFIDKYKAKIGFFKYEDKIRYYCNKECYDRHYGNE